jgi:hypothetical protein
MTNFSVKNLIFTFFAFAFSGFYTPINKELSP